MTSLVGMKVVTSEYMVYPAYKTPAYRARGWWERLTEKTTVLDRHYRPVSRWAPWVSTAVYMKTVYKPRMEFVVDQAHGVVYCHPTLLKRLRTEMLCVPYPSWHLVGTMSGLYRDPGTFHVSDVA